ncbi:DUF2273 domain-containing protein [Hoyosella sp. YIM 151337]|uniref:DUF2273 domain-containing protein n=1 Tax=Hoyosella sp. YIM 151337 TaxID=2992742 RepID=UPI00223661E9|nr:DUF2273 domain-containing protein [Hoyosella sp. YIM 151337]MCW4351901.1 DUF2273 domain-containing protein [Hoyosella sp. YIM 151337]
MNSTAVGLFTGLLLALAFILGGGSGLFLALAFGAAGLVLGAHRDGYIDLGALLRSRGRG